MPERSDELEAKLMAKAQEAIRKLLAEQKPKEAIRLSDMEISVGEFGEALLQDIMQELVSDASENEGHSLTCPTCQNVMRYKGQKSKRMVTLRGEIEIKRDYYYCEQCRSGLFPPR
jgi:hypothetical protein